MRIKRGLIYKKGGTPLFEKVRVAHKLLENWPMLVLDRTGMATEILYRTRSGLRFLCRGNTSDVGVVGAVLDGREYPPQFLDLPRSGLTVFDVGANIGAFSVYFSSLNSETPHQLYAFEPFVDNLRLLRVNCALNEVTPTEIVHAAVLGTEGSAGLDTSSEMGEVVVTTSIDGTSVEAVRLSSFCKSRNIERVHLMKMDVEGSEYDILEADADFIRARVDNLIVEYHESTSGRYIDWIRELLAPTFDIDIVAETPRTGVFYATRRPEPLQAK